MGENGTIAARKRRAFTSNRHPFRRAASAWRLGLDGSWLSQYSRRVGSYRCCCDPSRWDYAFSNGLGCSLRNFIWRSRFGFGEVNALLFASDRGLKVPKVYGYGGINGAFNLRKAEFLIMQDLDNHTDIGQLLESNRRDQEECKSVLRRAVPLFMKLYESNCNHSDLNLGSILLSNDSCCDDYLLDFEFSKFHKAPSLELLMFHAGYFIDHCSDYLTEETTDWWFREVVEAIKTCDLPAEKHLKDRFNFHRDRYLLRRKKRMKVY
ncbi:MAG: hypothetical protein B6I25_07635 [Planctomycetales bacterium 4572_13]|nr:MAG: hypothetical protein B6I25_07635 [Planctomycetales bacterium 4572_13]